MKRFIPFIFIALLTTMLMADMQPLVKLVAISKASTEKGEPIWWDAKGKIIKDKALTDRYNQIHINHSGLFGAKYTKYPYILYFQSDFRMTYRIKIQNFSMTSTLPQEQVKNGFYQAFHATVPDSEDTFDLQCQVSTGLFHETGRIEFNKRGLNADTISLALKPFILKYANFYFFPLIQQHNHLILHATYQVDDLQDNKDFVGFFSLKTEDQAGTIKRVDMVGLPIEDNGETHRLNLTIPGKLSDYKNLILCTQNAKEYHFRKIPTKPAQ